MSLPVRAGAVKPPPCLLMPLFVGQLTAQLRQWCALAHRLTRSRPVSTIRPSLSNKHSHPTSHHGAVSVSPSPAPEESPSSVRDASSTNSAPVLEHHFAFCKLADANFGALQIGHDGHFRGLHAMRASRTKRGPVDVVLRFAVAEVQTKRH